MPVTDCHDLELVAPCCVSAPALALPQACAEPDQYGSQGAVLLFAVAAILVVHVVITARACSAASVGAADRRAHEPRSPPSSSRMRTGR